MTRKQIIKIIISVLIAALTVLVTAFGLRSCNVVRIITTRSESDKRRGRAFWTHPQSYYQISFSSVKPPPPPE